MQFRNTDKFYACSNEQANQHVSLRTSGSEDMDESDHQDWKGIIDTRHMHARQIGKQAMSQFGHGKYTVKIMIWPNTSSDNTQHAIGSIKAEYVMPTPARYAALAHLKTLERNNIETMNGPAVQFDKEAHPLLVANIDSHVAAAGSGEGSTASGNKGAKVIRFTYDADQSVYANDAFVVDLDGDGNVTDANEIKYYTLMHDTDSHFGVLGRYEAAVNTLVAENVHVVDKEWDKPLCSLKVWGNSQQIQPVSFAFGDEGASGDLGVARVQQATFSGIEALGGLIKITIPDLWSRGDTGENNDFDIYATVTCHSWTPMKK